MKEINIRKAALTDAEAIYAIEAETIQHSFNKSMDSVEAITQLLTSLAEPYPFLVATVGTNDNEEIIGFAYASPFSPRIAFNHSCVAYLQMAPHYIFSNASQLLLNALESELQKAAIIQILVSLESKNDTYRQFLLANNFNNVGHLPQVDYQASQWHDITWMMKTLVPKI